MVLWWFKVPRMVRLTADFTCGYGYSSGSSLVLSEKL